jgi:hypothetical protein
MVRLSGLPNGECAEQAEAEAHKESQLSVVYVEFTGSRLPASHHTEGESQTVDVLWQGGQLKAIDRAVPGILELVIII